MEDDKGRDHMVKSYQLGFKHHMPKPTFASLSDHIGEYMQDYWDDYLV